MAVMGLTGVTDRGNSSSGASTPTSQVSGNAAASLSVSGMYGVPPPGQPHQFYVQGGAGAGGSGPMPTAIPNFLPGGAGGSNTNQDMRQPPPPQMPPQGAQGGAAGAGGVPQSQVSMPSAPSGGPPYPYDPRQYGRTAMAGGVPNMGNRRNSNNPPTGLGVTPTGNPGSGGHPPPPDQNRPGSAAGAAPTYVPSHPVMQYGAYAPAHHAPPGPYQGGIPLQPPPNTHQQQHMGFYQMHAAAAAAAMTHTTMPGPYQGMQQVGGGAAAMRSIAPPFVPRMRKPLEIKDKDGNVIDLKAPKKASGQGASSANKSADDVTFGSFGEDGSAAFSEKQQAAENKKKEEAELKQKEAAEAAAVAAAKKKAEEEVAARKKAEEEVAARKKAEEEAKIAAEEAARKKAEEEEAAKLAAEEAARVKAEEEAARIKAEEAAAAQAAAEEAARKKKLEEEATAALKAAEEAERKRLEVIEMTRILEEERARAEKKAAEEEEQRRRKVQDAASKPLSSRTIRAEESTPVATIATPAPGLRPGGFRPGRSAISAGLRPGGFRPGGSSMASASAVSADSSGVGNGTKKIYTKEALLRFKDHETCLCKPSNLPDMTIGLGGGQGSNSRRQSSSRPSANDWKRATGQSFKGTSGSGPVNRPSNNQDKWSRSERLPQPPPNRGHQGHQGHHGHNRHHHDQPSYDGPVKALKVSENRWKPVKDNSEKAAAVKKVFSILNKMTREKFDKLAGQICDIEISSRAILEVIIQNVFAKAIDEPAFGGIYAELCKRMSDRVTPESFIHAIPNIDGDMQEISFRWSSDVDAADSEVIGPFSSANECISAARDGGNDRTPRNGMDMLLEKLCVRDNIFIKVLKLNDSKSEKDVFYTVFFSLDNSKECGLELSENSFPTAEACKKDAVKKNSFKRSLLNMCQLEFEKQDIYAEFQKEKAKFNASRSKLSKKEQDDKEEELEFRRIKIKKQMLGFIRFIGELYKIRMLKEHIMHECIRSLLKISMTKSDDGEITLSNIENDEMDEEDHEALCKLFMTIGSTIDNSKSKDFMKVYFKKISVMTKDTTLPSRTRFMYQDLIEQRGNNWELRREIETAKTLDEIRKDAEREERAAQAASAANNNNRGNYDNRGGNRGNQRDYRGGQDNRRHSTYGSNNRQGGDRQGGGGYRGGGGGGGGGYGDNRRSSYNQPAADADGFTPVGTKVGGRGGYAVSPAVVAAPTRVLSKPPATSGSLPRALTGEKLSNRCKNIRQEYLADTNQSELLLSMDELANSPDAYKIFVEKTVENILDGRDTERPTSIRMLVIVAQKGKIAPKDFEAGILSLLEFINDLKVDIPRVYDYFADIFSALFKVRAVSAAWFLASIKKHMTKKDAFTLLSMTNSKMSPVDARSFLSPMEKAIADIVGSPELERLRSTW